MELFHTSPEAISEITTDGMFGEFLFFSASVYAMSDYKACYSVEISESDIIDASDLFYHENAEKLSGFVSDVQRMTGCDEDTAESLISQLEDIHSIESEVDAQDMANISWEIQKITAKAAKALGFRGVTMQDEQGACYMIDMLGKENELNVIED